MCDNVYVSSVCVCVCVCMCVCVCVHVSKFIFEKYVSKQIGMLT